MAITGVSVDVTDIDKGMADVIRRLEQENPSHVDIGILAKEGSELIQIAAAHEFGATINHPGGTDYGYRTRADANKGKVRFLKKGEGFMVLGTTGPHVIVIPMRSYIRSTIDEKAGEIQEFALQQARLIRDGTMDKEEALNRIGIKITGLIQEKIIDLKEPELKAATIRAKLKSAGGANPLVATGRLGRSISHALGQDSA